MKRLSIYFVAIISFLLLCTSTANADYGGTNDNVTWLLDESGLLTITGTGEMTYRNSSDCPWDQYRDSIQSVTIGNGITTISKYSFWNCTALRNVSIPSTVVTIGPYAFYNCINLQQISFPGELIGIDEKAFYNCENLTTVIMPKRCSYINAYAFYNCNKLTSFCVPEGVERLMGDTFNYCNNLTSISLPNSLFQIAAYDFSNCSNLQEITLPDSISLFDSRAFDGCTTLSKVIYTPNSKTAKTLSEKGFFTTYAGCALEGSIRLGDRYYSITDYFEKPLSGDISIKVIDWTSDGRLVGVNPGCIKKTIKVNGTTTMSLFITVLNFPSGTSPLPCIHIPMQMSKKDPTCIETGLTEGEQCYVCGEVLKAQAVINALGHTEVIDKAISATCTESGLTAGSHCSVCGDVIVAQEKVPAMGHKEVIDQAVPATTESTGLTEGKHCERCGEVLVAQQVIQYNATIIDSGTCGDNMTWTLDEEGLLTIFGSGYMTSHPWERRSVKQLKISDGVANIVNGAFYDCAYLTKAELPESITTIGEDAFAYCYKLSTISIPDSVKTIGNGAFRYCTTMTKIKLSNNIKTISLNAFDSCWSLESIDIPESVTTIGAQAFYKCRGLYEVTIPKNVVSLSIQAFRSCTGLNSVTVMGDVSINLYCFDGCEKLRTVILNGDVAQIDKGAFSGCSLLNSIRFSGLIKKIGDNSFEDCYSLKNIEIPCCNKNAIQQFTDAGFENALNIEQHIDIVIDYAMEPTCTEEGHTEGSHCSVCNEVLVAQAAIPAKGHTEVIDPAIAATCTETGLTEGKHCSVCGEILVKQEVIPKLTPDTPETKIKAFVSRCYQLILNREADEGGLTGWSDALIGKTATAAQIIDGFVRSDEFTKRNLSDDAKVDILYKTMLNREADAGGKAGWVDALSKGYTLQNIIDGFCGSAEFTAMCKDYGIEPGSVGAAAPTDTSTPRGKIEAFVKRCYQLILNRQADEGGLKGWSDALEGKTAAAAQIIDGFVRSPEYINRSLTSDQSVTILYKTMLDREPDEGGKAGWVDALSKGYTLQHIINGFCGSAEFTKICSDYGIQAGSVAVPVQSAAALEAAAQLEAKKLPDERIGNAVSADDAGITVVNGYEPAEVEAFVKHAYRAALGREADEAGLAGWTEQIVSGAVAPKAFLRTLLSSDEQIARKLNNEQFIEMLYRLYLNRGMDDAAADRVAQLAAGGLEEVIKGFESSAEFRLVLNGFGL